MHVFTHLKAESKGKTGLGVYPDGMAILGAEATVFDAYDRGIAAEYRAVVPGWLFRINRKRFLKSLLGREWIYLTPFFHQRLDALARNNLRRAVTSKR